ncbi:hypothetical protein [Fluviicola taffensis]|uniref:Uncharacterized protein n=1 Tax=Fluviicola taffensis (strain DSM 16823 / NCIMB 13979 / RW262) TaxID=755732 RepID=F2IGT5_FLUTR|nr:hypothetical protein [Fluviicola taffensis]AEA43702.1 hypothetical protein Fluta_1710 [Fluviicola taffensis DSM 16823]
MKEKRLVIYPKDIMLITGKSERYCRYLMKKMKAHFNKETHQVITVIEFSKYLGLDAEKVNEIII